METAHVGQLPSEDEIKARFLEQKPLYTRLSTNLTRALSQLMEENNIEIHAIEHRIKDIDSFIEKCQRKGYIDPINQIEDVCGLRIICFFKSDLSKIDAVLKNEFDVVESLNKSDILHDNEFGYRSNHYIIKIKEGWLSEPSYRGLRELKAEIQVRTILEHAWAGIQHKLAYKIEAHVPSESKRKFSQLMALLELADESFDSLRLQKAQYRVDIGERGIKTESEKLDISKLQLNQDSLQLFFDEHFPGRNRRESSTAEFLDDMIANKLSLKDLEDTYQRSKHVIDKYDELFSRMNQQSKRFAQAGIMRMLLEYDNEKYKDWRDRRGSLSPFTKQILNPR